MAIDLAYTAAQRAFRAEVREWMRAHVPREPLQTLEGEVGFEQHRAWERTLASGDFGMIDLLADVDNTDVNEDYHLELFGLDPGSYTLHVQGTRGRTSTYSGSISFAAVPEPATWAMMLLGFGAIGFALRRRRAPVLAQVA